MSKSRDRATVVYPVLGTDVCDLWFMRVSGWGLGNCFFTYFHAVTLADAHGAALITPPWFSLKIGPLVRRERSKRSYWGVFRPFAGEIVGLEKLLLLLRTYRRRVRVDVGGMTPPVLVEGALNLVASRKFTFVGLHAYRARIRERMLGMVNDPLPPNHRWGSGGYIALHVRLGDFVTLAPAAVVDAVQGNVRIPMSWYVNVLTALQRRYGDTPVRVFSDGEEDALRPLLDRGATLERTGSDMTDLLALSGASLLVGSNSTYSRWAAFLGDMPSIWLQTTTRPEKPSAADTPILYVPLDAAEPALWERSPFYAADGTANE